MRRVALAFPIAALALVAVVDAVQDAEIRGATIALAQRAVIVRTVTIENRRPSPLLAWAIRTTDGPGTGSIVSSSDFTSQFAESRPDSGPIAPGAQRILEVPLTPGTNGPPPTLELAVFADGLIDGTAAGIARWRTERREHAEDAAYWRDAFAKMPRESEERAKEDLAARVAERAAVSPTDHSGTRGRLFRLWQQTPQSPGFVFALVESSEKEAARQAELLKRTLAAPQSLESAAPVSIASRQSTKTQYVVAISNLRDSAIEAVAFDHYLSSSDRPSGGQAMDFCTTDPAARDGRGRIARGETREFPFSRETAASATPPRVRLRYVLFDDLSFEGRGADRDELFRRREELADDMAYANGVRAELAKVPDGDLQKFLEKKKTERVAYLLSLKRFPSVYALDRVIEDAARSPARLRETAAAAIAREEEQRLRLRRHVR
jgi:hypothetical protein